MKGGEKVNTVMFDIQAAAMAAALNSDPIMTDTEAAGDGVSFADILASQTAQASQAAQTAQTAQAVNTDQENVTGGIEIPAGTALSGDLSEIIAQLNKADDGMLKGLKILLDAVIKAMKGSDDGKERKTDLFSILFDGGAELDDEDENILLLCGEFMDRIGEAFSMELNVGYSDEDKILDELEEIVSAVCSSDDDKDEKEAYNEAMSILAAMMNVPAESFEEFSFAEAPEAAERITEVFGAVKQAVTESEPQMAEKMEDLYKEYADTVVSVKEEAPQKPESVNITFIGVKINDAEKQLAEINGVSAAELNVPDADVPEILTETFTAEDGLDPEIRGSVDVQLFEAISEKLGTMTDNSGTEELVLILRPRELGQVAVKLVKENGAVSVMLSAQHAEVGRMIAEHASLLSGSLESRNVQVKSIDVVEPGAAAAQMGLDFTDRGFGRGRDYSGEDGSRRSGGIPAVSGIDETDETEENIEIREAKLWTRA